MPDALPLLLRIDDADTVAVALRPLEAGCTALGVTLLQDVPQGHKVALRAHGAGEAVTKFGQQIGCARVTIAAGEHVHSHNLATGLTGELAYASNLSATLSGSTASNATWQGYRRGDGRAATRNEV